MSTLGIAVIAGTAAILPTWAGWIGLITYGLGWGLGGLLLGRHLALRHLDRMLNTARLLTPCPTCSGPIRETVGMVCQTCGSDYGPEDQCGPQPNLPDPGQVGDPHWPGLFSRRTPDA